MLNSLKRYVMLSLVVIGALLAAAWRITLGKLKRSQSETERALNSLKAAQKKQEKENKAKTASADAKAKGDESIKKAVDNARSGRRDHFMRDKD